jgi:hypothetical protein
VTLPLSAIALAIICDHHVVDVNSFILHFIADITKGGIMSNRRVIARDWIVELGRDPLMGWHGNYERTAEYNEEIIAAVRWAIDGLERNEGEFVRMYYLQGMSYSQISNTTGDGVPCLARTHRSVKKKLRLRIHKVLAGRYHVPARLRFDCPLCDHRRTEEIDDLLRSKAEHETWRRTIRILKMRFRMTDITPGMLITHREYHML